MAILEGLVFLMSEVPLHFSCDALHPAIPQLLEIEDTRRPRVLPTIGLLPGA